jgi:hypothetical protein
MGQATRTTKLLLDLGKRGQGGANTGKRVSLEETARLLDAARAFYVAFFLAHPDKLEEKVCYFSEHLQEERERLISPHELLTWAETLTVETAALEHPITPRSMTKRSAWTWTGATCARAHAPASSGSRSTPEPRGDGRTTL